MKSGVLRGREHVTVGGVSAVAEGGAAIAISRGGARKTYHYKDPNEDAAGFAEGPEGTLLVVADGHGGHDAAEAALEHVLQSFAPAWTCSEAGELAGALEAWEHAAHQALLETNTAILQRVARGGADTARTTLALALIRPRENLLAWASAGDSHIFPLWGSNLRDLARDEGVRPHYLGSPSETRETLAPRCVVGTAPLDGTTALALVTDGLSERGIGVADPPGTVVTCASRAADEPADLRPLTLARSVVEAALEAQRSNNAGDNVASAVVWLSG